MVFGTQKALVEIVDRFLSTIGKREDFNENDESSAEQVADSQSALYQTMIAAIVPEPMKVS